MWRCEQFSRCFCKKVRFTLSRRLPKMRASPFKVEPRNVSAHHRTGGVLTHQPLFRALFVKTKMAPAPSMFKIESCVWILLWRAKAILPVVRSLSFSLSLPLSSLSFPLSLPQQKLNHFHQFRLTSTVRATKSCNVRRHGPWNALENFVFAIRHALREQQSANWSASMLGSQILSRHSYRAFVSCSKPTDRLEVRVCLLHDCLVWTGWGFDHQLSNDLIKNDGGLHADKPCPLIWFYCRSIALVACNFSAEIGIL